MPAAELSQRRHVRVVRHLHGKLERLRDLPAKGQAVPFEVRGLDHGALVVHDARRADSHAEHRRGRRLDQRLREPEDRIQTTASPRRATRQRPAVVDSTGQVDQRPLEGPA